MRSLRRFFSLKVGGLAALVLFCLIVLVSRRSAGKVDFFRPGFKPGLFPASFDRLSIAVISSKGSFKRVEQYCSKWRPPEAPLTVWVDELPPVMSDEFDGITHVSTANTTSWWNKTKRDHHTRLAWTMWDVYELQQDVDWYLVVDDDAVVFPQGLLAILQKYDPADLWYLGNISEDWHQVQIHGRMAYGGGGFVLSKPAAKMLHDILAECLPRHDAVYGQDSRVFSCLSELDIPLTVEPGFHQFDLEGDIRGILEQHPPKPLITLHHLPVLDPFFPHLSFEESLDLVLRAAKVLRANFVQQSVMVNRVNQWTFSLSHGFSLKWFERAKLVPWVKNVEITFNRFVKRRHHGPGDWTFDTRRRATRCWQYDTFYWSGITADGRHKYMHSEEPLCGLFIMVNVIYVTILPGTFPDEKGCGSKNAADALLQDDVSLMLCGTHSSLLLEFSVSTDENVVDPPEVKTELKTKILGSRFQQNEL